MGDSVGIKYVNNIYVVSKDGKYNIYVVAVTVDDRKIGSGIFATKDDVKNMYDAVVASENVDKIRFECILSSGTKILIYKTNVPLADGLIPIYELHVEDREFVSRMSERALDEFYYSVKQNYESMNNPGSDNEFDLSKKKKEIRIGAKEQNPNPIKTYINNRRQRRIRKKKGVFDK